MSTHIKPEVISEEKVPQTKMIQENHNTSGAKTKRLSITINQIRSVPLELTNPLPNFGWTTIGKKPPIPFVRRGSECYVANQIFVPTLFSEYLKILPMKAVDWINLQIQPMTQSEADVFNEINVEHCDRSLVGKFKFEQGHKMSCLEDVQQAVKFFQVYKDALYYKQIKNDLFGFLAIGNDRESVVPFVWSEGQQLMPLFYFDGNCEYLETNSVELTDKWKIGFLKFCCLLQNIGKNHYEGKPLKMTSFEHVKAMFPGDTKFELHWPKNVNQELLTPEQLKNLPQVTGQIQQNLPINTKEKASTEQLKNLPQVTGQIQQNPSKNIKEKASTEQLKNLPQVTGQIQQNPPINTKGKASKRPTYTVTSRNAKEPKIQNVGSKQTTNVPYRSPQTASSPGLYNPNIPLTETVASQNSVNTQLQHASSTSQNPANFSNCEKRFNLITPVVKEHIVGYFMKCLRLYGSNHVESNIESIIQQFITQYGMSGPNEQLGFTEMRNLWREIKENKDLLSMPTTPNYSSASTSIGSEYIKVPNVTNSTQVPISVSSRMNVEHQRQGNVIAHGSILPSDYFQNFARIEKVQHINMDRPLGMPYLVKWCNIRHKTILGISFSPFVTEFLVNFSEFVAKCLQPNEYEHFRLSSFARLYSLNVAQETQWQKLQQSRQVMYSNIFPNVFVSYSEILAKFSILC